SGLLAAIGTVYMQHENDKSAAESTTELKGTITGGDSYCYLDPEVNSDATLTLKFVNGGRFPLQSVVAQIIDANKSDAYVQEHQLKKHESLRFDELRAAAFTTVPVGSIAAGGVVMFNSHYPIASNEQTFTINFSALNGFWTENIVIKRLADGWHPAF